MCSSEVWKTRLWSLSSVWTRAVQLEDETNQHLALVPFKWGRGERGNWDWGLAWVGLIFCEVQKRWEWVVSLSSFCWISWDEKVRGLCHG